MCFVELLDVERSDDSKAYAQKGIKLAVGETSFWSSGGEFSNLSTFPIKGVK